MEVLQHWQCQGGEAAQLRKKSSEEGEGGTVPGWSLTAAFLLVQWRCCLSLNWYGLDWAEPFSTGILTEARAATLAASA